MEVKKIVKITHPQTKEERPRLAFFLSHPVQYMAPLLKVLNEQLDVHAYYFSDASVKGQVDKGFGQTVKWDMPLLDGYDHTFIPNFSRSKSVSNRFLDVINPGLFKYILKEPSKVIVVNGWTYFSVLLTIITARLAGKKVWLRAENPLHHEYYKSKKVIFLKRIILQYGLFKMVDKFLYIGSKNKEFFKFYGATEDQLIFTPYSVNNSFFNKQYIEYRKHKEELLQELNLPLNKKVILFSGKYINQKRPLDLIKSFKDMKYKDAVLVMVGEGELRKEMEIYIRERKIENVILTGFVNQSAISKYYSVADVFVMCSGIPETWGLSVNEAMNFAVPVIVSKTCGCSFDLVVEGKNGFTFNEGDLEALTSYLDRSLTNEAFLKNAGTMSKEIISKYNYNVTVNNLYSAMIKHGFHES